MRRFVRKNWALGIVLAACILHFIWLLAHLEPAYSSPDANGYFVQARLIAEKGRTWFKPQSPLQFIGIHWLEAPGGKYYSRYPPGFPLLLAILYKACGPRPALALNPVLASASVLLLFLFSRFFLGPVPSLVSAFLLAINPVANMHALHSDSHTCVLFFILLGLTLLFYWRRSRSRILGLIAGICLGYIPLIRYPEIVVMIGAFSYLFLEARKERVLRKGLPLVAVGFLIPLVFLLSRNHFAFDAFWRTGYSLTGEQAGFSLEFFLAHWIPYLESLMSQSPSLVFVLGIAGALIMALNKTTRSWGFLFIGAIVPLTLVYMAYYWGGGRAGLRFLLPTFPFYFVCGTWFLSNALEKKYQTAVFLLVVFLQATIWVPGSIDVVSMEQEAARGASRLYSWLEKNTKEGSVLIGDRRVHESLEFFGRWKLVDKSFFLPGRRGPRPLRGRANKRRAMDDAGGPNPVQAGKEEKRRSYYMNLDPQTRSMALLGDLILFAGKGNRIYWIGNERELELFNDETRGAVSYTRKGEIKRIFHARKPGAAGMKDFRPFPGPAFRPPGWKAPSGAVEIFELDI